MPLGKPILQVSAQDTMDEKKSDFLTSILRQWIIIDRLNIVNMDSGMHWIIGPKDYETNKLLQMKDLLQYFFSPPLVRNDLQKKVESNFGRTAIALNVLLKRKQINEGQLNIEDEKTIEVLDKVISMEFGKLVQEAKKGYQQ